MTDEQNIRTGVTDDAAVARHVEDWHQWTPQALAKMVAEHRELYDELRPKAEETHSMVGMILDEMYGERKPTLNDPNHRTGGFVEQIDAMYHIIGNGGIRLKLTKTQWTFLGSTLAALIAGTVSIIVAVIG